MKETFPRPFSGVDISVIEALEDEFEQVSFDCASSSMSGDGLSSSEALSVSFGELRSEHGCASSSSGSSPLVGGWSLCTADKGHQSARLSANGVKPVLCCASWDEKRHRELSEVDMMKEKFSKLLLGEDMSGGGKGVCSALAISNAITNLSASVFGELWRLEPLSNLRKAMWRRELDWLLSVADHIVELVPCMQTFADGSKFEVMVTRRRSDLLVNLPGLRKLDAMLMEALDNFTQTEFWYVDQGVVADQDDSNSLPPAHTHTRQHVQEEKWWLPSPKVPVNGLTEEGRKRLQYQRESLSQILKAALAINSQVLSEMEIPAAYWDGLPKNGKASLGERIYRHVTSEYFSPEALLSSLDLSTEHKALAVANRVEAAMHMWRRRRHPRNPQILSKDCKHNNRNSSWGAVKDFVSDTDRREFLAARAEAVLLCLKQKFPGLRQSLLDMTKIQHNKDVGHSILESYSRVLESLAFNIIARIDDVLRVDDMTKHSLPPPPPAVKTRSQRRVYSLSLSVHTPHVTPLGSPSTSPTPSPTPRRTPNSPFHDEEQEDPDYMITYSYEFVNDGHNDSLRMKKASME